MLSKRLVFAGSFITAALIGIAGVGPLKTSGADAASFNTSLQGSSNLTAGQYGTFSVVTQDGANPVSGAIVDVEIYNSGNQRVYQQFVSGQNFGAGQQITNTISWTPATAGSYTAKVGVFTSNWGSNLVWNDDAMKI